MGAKKFLEKIGVIEESEQSPSAIRVDQPADRTSVEVKTEPRLSSNDDLDMINVLQQKIETSLSNVKAPIGGVDFLNMMQSIKKSEAIITDETSRFKTAILFAKTMNPSLNKNEIISSADYYIEELDNIKTEFISSTDKVTKTVELQRSELRSTEERIQQLNNDLAELNVKKTSLETEINQTTRKTETASNAFEIAFNKIKNGLLTDKEKILQYI